MRTCTTPVPARRARSQRPVTDPSARHPVRVNGWSPRLRRRRRLTVPTRATPAGQRPLTPTRRAGRELDERRNRRATKKHEPGHRPREEAAARAERNTTLMTLPIARRQRRCRSTALGPRSPGGRPPSRPGAAPPGRTRPRRAGWSVGAPTTSAALYARSDAEGMCLL